MTSEYELIEAPSDLPEESKAIYTKMSQIVEAVAKSTQFIVESELNRAVRDQAVAQHLKDVAPYLSAAGTLAYSGKDVDADGIKKLLSAASIPINPRIGSLISNLKFKNHLVYIVAIFFIIGIGKDPDLESLINVVRAMDVHPDKALAQKALETYKLITNNKATNNKA